MLRILVIALFVVNLLLFAFWDNETAVQPKTPVKTAARQDSSIPTIHLFNEMMEDQDLMTNGRRCFSLGPFHSLDEVDEVYASLVEVTVSIKERKSQALVEKGYWVYLSPYKDLVEANQVLFSLQGLGLKDVGVIYNGEWTNGISLGYFRRQENALKRKQSLEDRGYTPLIRVRRAAEDRYWLDYEQNPGSALIALDMQNRPNDFMQRALPCPEQEVRDTPLAQPVEQVATAVPAAVKTPVQEVVEVDEPVQEEVVESTPQDSDPEPEQSADSVTENSEPVDSEPVDSEPVDSEPVDSEPENIQPQQEDPGQSPQTEDSDTNPDDSEEPLLIDNDESQPGDNEEPQAIEINEAYLEPDNDTQLIDVTDSELQELIDTGLDEATQAMEETTDIPPEEDALIPEDIEGSLPENTEPEQTEDDDPYDGNEIDIDAG
jgi:hypothetical protein